MTKSSLVKSQFTRSPGSLALLRLFRFLVGFSGKASFMASDYIWSYMRLPLAHDGGDLPHIVHSRVSSCYCSRKPLQSLTNRWWKRRSRESANKYTGKDLLHIPHGPKMGIEPCPAEGNAAKELSTLLKYQALMALLLRRRRLQGRDDRLRTC